MTHVGRVYLAKKKKVDLQVNSTTTELEVICSFHPDLQDDIKSFEKKPSQATQKLLEVFESMTKTCPDTSTIDRNLDEIVIRITNGTFPIHNNQRHNNLHVDAYVSGALINTCAKIVGRSSLRTLRLKVECKDKLRNEKIISIAGPLEPALLSYDRDNIIFQAPFELCQFKNRFDSQSLSSGQLADYETIVHMDLTAGVENVFVDDPTMIPVNLFRDFQKKILNQQFGTDTTIVGENGFSIGCHKIFLMGQSPVFEAMLDNTHFEEGRTSTVQMPDMSESAIKTLLNFLYFLPDDPTTTADFDTIVELLHASEKYGIDRLKTALLTGLMEKPINTITAADALQIFFFTRNAQGFEELQAKAVHVLKLQCEMVMQMEEYKKLFHDYPEVAMELCNAIFQAQ